MLIIDTMEMYIMKQECIQQAEFSVDTISFYFHNLLLFIFCCCGFFFSIHNLFVCFANTYISSKFMYWLFKLLSRFSGSVRSVSKWQFTWNKTLVLPHHLEALDALTEILNGNSIISRSRGSLTPSSHSKFPKSYWVGAPSFDLRLLW